MVLTMILKIGKGFPLKKSKKLWSMDCLSRVKSRGGLWTKTGFTFLELLIVLLVVGLLTAASVPAFKTFSENMRLRAGARLTLNLLRQARANAIANHRATYVVIPTSGDIWSDLHYKGMKIVYEDSPNVYVTLSNWEYLPKGLQIDSGSSIFGGGGETIDIRYPHDYSEGGVVRPVCCVKFKSSGGATTNGSIVIELIDDASRSKTVTYLSTSGRAKID